MNYQQTIKSDGSVDTDSIVAIDDDGSRDLVWSSATDARWIAYQDWLTAGNKPLPIYADRTLPNAIEAYVNSIDARVAMIYTNWTRFEREYELREDAARAFKAAGYAGDPGPWVSAFATSAGMTNQQSADLIIAQADQLHAALATLGAQRMRKYEIARAADIAGAQATYAEITASINTIAGGLS